MRENADTLLMELQGQITESKLQLNSIQERLSVEFNIKVEELETTSDQPTELDEDALKDKVEKLKNRLETMGPINPMAMEAFEEIKERYDFIIKERMIW